MTITYRNDGAWGSGKGSRLTSTEVDNNFYDLASRVLDLEDLPVGVFIEDVTFTGGSITFHLSDTTTRGPFPLPVALLSPKGEWLPNTSYFYLDLVTVSDTGVFLVLRDHTSESEFDPDAGDTDGDFYSLWFPFPNVVGYLKNRGEYTSATEYFVDDVFTDDEFGLFVVLADHISDTTFDPHAEDTAGPLYKQIALPIRVPVGTVSTATYTLVLDDANHYLRFTNAAGCVITVPNFEDVAFEVGDEIHIRVVTDGEVSVDAGTGVTVNGITGFFDAGAANGAVMTLKNVAVDEWDLFGMLLSESTA